jgi:hypothetical protein
VQVAIELRDQRWSGSSASICYRHRPTAVMDFADIATILVTVTIVVCFAGFVVLLWIFRG